MSAEVDQSENVTFKAFFILTTRVLSNGVSCSMSVVVMALKKCITKTTLSCVNVCESNSRF